MQVHDGELLRARQLACTGKELGREARTRLAWMDFYRRSSNVARTCRHFGISGQTFYRWQLRYDPQNLATLEERSHRPHSAASGHLVCPSGGSRPGAPALRQKLIEIPKISPHRRRNASGFLLTAP
jgi:hypothetical protein